VVVLQPGRPESKGQVERTNGYLDTSFLPLHTFNDVEDLQGQHDDWVGEIGYRRHHRRVGAIVGDAWRVERGFLRALPDPSPTTERHGEAHHPISDTRVRTILWEVGTGTASSGSGTSITRFHRAWSAVECRSARVVVHEGREVARDQRSYVPPTR
jgi:hypothetical protein